MRLDQELVRRNLFDSREKAKRAILAGLVRVKGRNIVKPGDKIKEDDEIEIVAEEKFVSRGGYKLEYALKHFYLDVSAKVALDIGASTGGFTDCLLQYGAKKVYAIDVGQGQLAYKLRTDPRVVVMEKVNARYLTISDFPQPYEPADLAVIDCSFISLKLIIPPVANLLRTPATIIALIKPQFEAGKKHADKGKGVITDPQIHQTVIADLQNFVQSKTNLLWRGTVESPIQGASGNKEFLVLLEKEN